MLDVIEKREPFFKDSYGALCKALEAKDVLLVTATAATDIFYLLCKHFHSTHKAKSCIKRLSEVVVFADVLGSDIQVALTRNMSDFEDAVVDAVAERNGADCILTRNAKDFGMSKVPAVLPTDFLK